MSLQVARRSIWLHDDYGHLYAGILQKELLFVSAATREYQFWDQRLAGHSCCRLTRMLEGGRGRSARHKCLLAALEERGY